jgi:hypothetical protein
MVRQKAIVVWAGILLLSIGAGGPPGGVKASVDTAVEKRETAAKLAAQEYKQKLAIADRQLVSDLGNAIRQAVRDGKLPVVKEMTDLQNKASDRSGAEKAEAPPVPLAWFKGRWHVRRWNDSATFIIGDRQAQVIQEDHVTTDTGPIVSATDTGLTVKYKNGWTDRFTRMGDRIGYESLDPAVKDAPNGSWTNCGVGVRIGDR